MHITAYVFQSVLDAMRGTLVKYVNKTAQSIVTLQDVTSMMVPVSAMLDTPVILVLSVQ